MPPAPDPRSAAGGTARLRERAPADWCLEGELTLEAVAALAREGDRLAAAAAAVPIVLDLRGIRRGSSAAIALLLEWQDLVQARGGRLRVCNLPDALRAIAEFSNVCALLGLEDEAAHGAAGAR